MKTPATSSSVPPTLKITPGNAQAQGDRVQQQDNFGFSNLADPILLARAGALAVVTDGMGGHALGQEASRLAKDTLLAGWKAKPPQESTPDALWRLVQQANNAVRRLAQQHHQLDNAGTTLAAAVVHQNQLYWIAVGDSRLYLYRQGRVTLLNNDHVYAKHLDQAVARGELRREDADEHPDRDALTSFLGIATLNEVDRNVRPFPLQAGDRILLCSDGLYRGLTEAELTETLGRADPQSAAEALKNLVLSKSYPHQDNLTVVILACDPDTAPPAPVAPRNHRRPNRPPPKPLTLGLLGAVVIGVVLTSWLWWRSESEPKKTPVAAPVLPQPLPDKPPTGEQPAGGPSAPESTPGATAPPPPTPEAAAAGPGGDAAPDQSATPPPQPDAGELPAPSPASQPEGTSESPSEADKQKSAPAGNKSQPATPQPRGATPPAGNKAEKTKPTPADQPNATPPPPAKKPPEGAPSDSSSYGFSDKQ